MKKTKLSKLSKRLKLTKKGRQQARLGGLAAVLVLVGILAGLTLADRLVNKPSSTRIWAADETVVIPDDLYTFLQDQPTCEQPVTKRRGVRLWAVMQVEQASFARLAYGCSTELEQYQMAVRFNGTWQLVPPDNYFADSETTSLPHCEIVKNYAIPAAIEPFCIDAKGKAKANE